MQANRTARLKQSAAECAKLAQKTRDPRAKAVLAMAATVWEKLADQQRHQASSKQLHDLVDLLDAAVVVDRVSR
jgi:hypothetical protein